MQNILVVAVLPVLRIFSATFSATKKTEVFKQNFICKKESVLPRLEVAHMPC